jgi:hypothetical protein
MLSAMRLHFAPDRCAASEPRNCENSRLAAALIWLMGVAALVSVLQSFDVSAQGRTLKKIEQRTRMADTNVTREQCRAAVHEIARAWGDAGLEDLLHPKFPNRLELLLAIRAARLRGSAVHLVVESTPAMRLVPIQDGGDGSGRQVTDCIVEVNTRIVFDDPTTGERSVGGPGRGEWRIRFEGRSGGSP